MIKLKPSALVTMLGSGLATTPPEDAINQLDLSPRRSPDRQRFAWSRLLGPLFARPGAWQALDALIGLARSVAPAGHQPAVLTHVKVRAFTEPGARLRLEAAPSAADASRIQLSVRAGDRTVATARLQTRPEIPA